MSDTTYVNCARTIDATRNDPGHGDARETAISIMVDLLAACKGLLDAIHDSMTHELQRHHAEQIDAARAAIARAEGGAQ